MLRDGKRQTETIEIPLEEVRCVAFLLKEPESTKE
jgi:hypothetical protein